MSQTLTANTQPQQTLSLHQVWLAALLRPSMTTYKMLGQQQRASVWHAYMWVFAGGLIGGTIDSLAPFESQLVERNSIDTLLLALIPVSSIIAVCYLAAFAWCTQKVTQLFHGSGTYRQLAYVFAAFSAPLLITASLLDLIPQARVFLVVLYVYWLALYVMAVHAVTGLARMKAIAAVLVALLILGLAWLGVAFVVGYSGMLLP